jgi:hypothetical protein
MRYLFTASLCALFVAAPAASAPAPKESWGKAGVTLAQYRQDALDCGLNGHYTDISKTDDARAFVNASKQLDAVTNGGASTPMTVESNATGPDTTNSLDQAVEYAAQQQHIVESIRPDERFKSIKKTLVSNDEQCLARRGYSKFALTDEQRRALRKLKAGSDARRLYLYNLASDPDVLQSQKAPAQP